MPGILLWGVQSPFHCLIWMFFAEIAKHPVICIDAAFVESLLYKFSFDTWMVCFFPSAHKNHYN
jgi:hypothetical protein